jgi:hypothetical protein
MGRPKGQPNITPDAKAFVTRVERMLRKQDPDTGSLELLACRLMTHPAHKAMETKFFADKGIVTDERELINWQARLKATEIAANVWRVLMAYKHGMPTQPIEANLTISYTEALTKMRAKRESGS